MLVAKAWAFFGVAVAMFGLVGVLAYQRKAASAAVVLVAATIAALVSRFDYVTEVEAGANGLKLKIAEASNVLDGLRRLAVVTSTSLIQLQVNQGALDGASGKDRDALKARVLDTLRSIGVDEAAIERVASEDRNRNLGEYLWAISAHLEFVSQRDKLDPRWRAEFPDLMARFPPSPIAISDLLRKYGYEDEFTNKALDEYRYYLEKGQHRDLAFWANRDGWPVSLPR